MNANKVRYPGPGCLVEFMQGNSPMLALVLEEQGGRLRVYSFNRRESTLAAGRLLPWSGPLLGTGLSRQRMDEVLAKHHSLRASMASSISALEIWELTQGEVSKTSAEWLAGLLWERPSVDQEAALGHVLLEAKTHFRFSPPDFEIFSEETVLARLAEAENARAREAFAFTGAQFFQKLWDRACRGRSSLSDSDIPEKELAETLKHMLLVRLRGAPEEGKDAQLWKLLVRGLPEHPHQELLLASAWGLVPAHYNLWLDKIGFERGEAWAEEFDAECAKLKKDATVALEMLEPYDAPFVSIDPGSAEDRDDAFFVQELAGGGYAVCVALACPAHVWPLGSPLDKAVQCRCSSLYLPEGNEHMLPASVGRALFSLDAGQKRAALLFHLRLGPDGELLETRPELRSVVLAANLDLESSEAALVSLGEDASCVKNSSLFSEKDAVALQNALPHALMLGKALDLAKILQARRIHGGAVITERPDPSIIIDGQGEEARVRIEDGAQAVRSHLLVSELMILVNSAVACWAQEREIPFLYRTQDVALPREFAGIWAEPQDIARVVRALPPATLDIAPRRHAGLGLAAYATVSSPIRRYTDLLNQSQLLHFLDTGSARLDAARLGPQLSFLSSRSDAVGQVQRLRPRYWKLLFFRQQGDRQWWDAVVAEENEVSATVALPWAQLVVRGRRRLFDEKIRPGTPVQVRLGKVNPLLNEIRILEVREA